MTSIYKGLTAASVLVMGLGVTPAVASCHGDWDTNSDTSIDQTEFGTAYNRVGWFGNANTDDSDSLSSDEFSAGLYAAYDRDDSGTFSALWDRFYTAAPLQLRQSVEQYRIVKSA